MAPQRYGGVDWEPVTEPGPHTFTEASQALNRSTEGRREEGTEAGLGIRCRSEGPSRCSRVPLPGSPSPEQLQLWSCTEACKVPPPVSPPTAQHRTKDRQHLGTQRSHSAMEGGREGRRQGGKGGEAQPVQRMGSPAHLSPGHGSPSRGRCHQELQMWHPAPSRPRMEPGMEPGPPHEVAGENRALWESVPQPIVPLEMAEMGSKSKEGHGC